MAQGLWGQRDEALLARAESLLCRMERSADRDLRDIAELMRLPDFTPADMHDDAELLAWIEKHEPLA